MQVLLGRNTINCCSFMIGYIPREIYLQKLIDGRLNGDVKVVTGPRRCGKSWLLKRLYKDYLIADGVPEEDIINQAMFYGTAMQPAADGSFRIEGQSPEDIEGLTLTGEVAWLLGRIRENPSLVQISKADLLTDNAIRWWMEKNPRAGKASGLDLFRFTEPDMQAVLFHAALADEGAGQQLPQAGMIRDKGRNGGEGHLGTALEPAVVLNIDMAVAGVGRQGMAGQHIAGGHMPDAGGVHHLGIHAAGLDDALKDGAGHGAAEGNHDHGAGGAGVQLTGIPGDDMNIQYRCHQKPSLTACRFSLHQASPAAMARFQKSKLWTPGSTHQVCG